MTLQRTVATTAEKTLPPQKMAAIDDLMALSVAMLN